MKTLATHIKTLVAFAFLGAAPAIHAVELTGAIRSATGALPPTLKIEADRADKGPLIVGTVEGNRYRIDMPESGFFRLRLEAPGWETPPKLIFDPHTTGARDFLIYPDPVPEPALAAELRAIGDADQELRQRPDAMRRDAEFIRAWQEADGKREARLAQIIDAGGWPAMSMVGHEAATGAWLIAQHGSPAFLKRCLPLMQAAADRGELAPALLALSIDRVLVNDGKPQRYGSQAQTNEDGKTFFPPIEDEAHLDARRFAMGMESFERYRATLLGK